MESMCYCQSCGMPLAAESDFGTEENGAKNTDYCVYCYEDGHFTDNRSMEEMIDFCVDVMRRQDPSLEEAALRSEMRKIFPTLKRWSVA